MNVYHALTEHKEKLSLIGLGYVGMLFDFLVLPYDTPADHVLHFCRNPI